MAIAVDSQARGVLFKESWFDRWHAYVNGRPVKVLRAGPGLMYVRLPQDTRFPATVQWRYEKSLADWAGIALAAAALIALVTWPRWRRPLSDWWERRTTSPTTANASPPRRCAPSRTPFPPHHST